MITRNQIMDFFRYDTEDLDNLYSLSECDRYELALNLMSHSSYIYEKLENAIENYENLNEENEQEHLKD